jgi:predicted thioesterase
MNFDRITDLTVHGRFRIPFPDTSYASRERRDALSVNGAGITNPGENTSPPVDRRSLRCFVTSHVVASIENLCASELAAHTNSAAESVVGSEVLLKHNHPAAVGSMVAVTARVTTIADASVTFAVEAKVGDLMIADGQLRFVIVARDRFAARPIQSVIERALAGDFVINRSSPVSSDVRDREVSERAAERSALPVFSVAI